MVVPVPHRRPFFDKLRSSALKRRLLVVCWLARLLGRDKRPITCRYLGAEFSVYPGEAINDDIAMNRYEWRELTMMLAAAREYQPKVFIDVGANVGVYSCILGKGGIVSRVVSYEPDRRNYARLAENIERNALAGIAQARGCAVGDRRGTASLTPGPEDNAGWSKLNGTGLDEYTVDVVTLDDELDIQGSSILIKIDVEDYEMEVLAGAERLLRRNGGYAQIEARGDEHADKVTKLMSDYGWRLIDRYLIDLSFERAVPGPAATDP